MERRQFIWSGLSSGAGVLFCTRKAQADFSSPDIQPKIENSIAWYDVEDWGVEGRGWDETLKYFDRLPAKAEKKVRSAVWGLSRHSAGMAVRFESNSPDIHVRYRLSSSNLAMTHMPATGVSGVDLYGDDGTGRLSWINVSRPTARDVTGQLAKTLDPLPDNRLRLFQAYLPLYNGVEKLEIGLTPKSGFRPLAPRKEKQLLFYGTSIMHGACASRPGMCISSILGRQLNSPVVNLGFSGNGKMEPEVGELICELNPGLVAIDCLPNMTGALVEQRAEKFVNLIRSKLKTVPILLVEDRSFTNSRFFRSKRNFHEENRKALRIAFRNLKSAGVPNLHYLKGESLLGTDGEAATDGSHPNDLGMLRYAGAYEKAIRRITLG